MANEEIQATVAELTGVPQTIIKPPKKSPPRKELELPERTDNLRRVFANLVETQIASCHNYHIKIGRSSQNLLNFALPDTNIYV